MKKRNTEELNGIEWLENKNIKNINIDIKNKNNCDAKTEVYSRVVGFYRPVEQWNNGKKEEFKDRQTYQV